MTDKVVFANISPGMVDTEMFDAVLSTVVRDQMRDKRIVGKIVKFAGANVSNSRNMVVNDFLEQFPSGDWLWMVDSDMTFTADALDQLLSVAHPDKAPIVGGLYFQRHVSSMDDLYRRRTTVSPQMFTIEDEELKQVLDYPKDSVTQVAATGTGFLLVHRGVFDKMLAEYGRPMPWFMETVYGDRLYGEDITFCLRAGNVGYPVFVHTGVVCGHKKPFVFTDADYTPLVDGWRDDADNT